MPERYCQYCGGPLDAAEPFAWYEIYGEGAHRRCIDAHWHKDSGFDDSGDDDLKDAGIGLPGHGARQGERNP